jgi:hypothetical protein
MEIKNNKIKSVIFISCLAIIALGLVMYGLKKNSGSTGLTINVLFIGNSLTSVNDLPKAVADIAKSLGDNLTYTVSDPGGYTLAQHLKNTDTLLKLKSGSWDYVVIQEQSELPALGDSRVKNEVLQYANTLTGLVRKPVTKAKPIFYETWGYKDGDIKYCASTPTLCSYSAMQDQLLKSYSQMAEQGNGLLAPVGEAWRLVIKTHPEINLYSSDGIHPAPEGSYLAACVFYTKLFNKPVLGATPLNINPDVAKILQQTAEQTIFKR